MIDVLASAGRLLHIAWRQHRRKTAVAVALMLAGTASAPLAALFLRALTDAAIAGRTATAVATGVAVAAVAIAGLTFAHLAHVAYFELSELAVLRFERELIALSNGTDAVAHHERAGYADRITVLEQELQHLRTGMAALLTGAGLVLSLLVTAVLLGSIDPVLLLLAVLAGPPLLAGRWGQRLVDRATDASAGDTRVALGLLRLSTTAGPAKELRVYGLQNVLRRRHGLRWTRATGVLWRAHRTAAVLRAGAQVLFAAGYVTAVLLVVRDAVAGDHTVGDVVLVVALAGQVNQQVAAAAAALVDLQRLASVFRRLDAVRAMVAEEEPAAVRAVTADRTPPARLRRGIDLVDVTFTYPGTDRPVLSGATVTLPAGATVAVVGENGAGKSTLVKLLCGFYRPTLGRVEIDGVDLRRMPAPAWRARIAAGFQDFVRFEFLAREAVGVGDLPRVDDDERVLAALDQVRATPLVDQLPAGLGTQLGREYADGFELSGGQWQKVALGRAAMRSDPLLVVLDEPASALDAAAEHTLFEQYARQARRVGAATGAVTVLVSHRFSTVRMADLIVVLVDGRIAETGSHDVLIGRGGLYAELYGLQAAGYA